MNRNSLELTKWAVVGGRPGRVSPAGRGGAKGIPGNGPAAAAPGTFMLDETGAATGMVGVPPGKKMKTRSQVKYGSGFPLKDRNQQMGGAYSGPSHGVLCLIYHHSQ